MTNPLSGRIARGTSNLLREASGEDPDLMTGLVRSGIELGMLTSHDGMWLWGGSAHTAPVRLTELIESRATALAVTQLNALERMTRPLAEPHTVVLRARLASAVERLTPREGEILRLLYEGLTAVAIARRLGLSPRTVGKHQENLYRKLGTSDRLVAVLHAQRLGIADT